MKVIYRISPWTSANRRRKLHIDCGEKFLKPLCGEENKNTVGWESIEGEPTCKKCISILREKNKGNCKICSYGEKYLGFFHICTRFDGQCKWEHKRGA